MARVASFKFMLYAGIPRLTQKKILTMEISQIKNPVSYVFRLI